MRLLERGLMALVDLGLWAVLLMVEMGLGGHLLPRYLLHPLAG